MSYSNKITEQQHQKTILSNGLTILSLTKKEVASVAIEVLVKVGSRHESLDLNGMAHFLEHMNFKGTAKRSAKQIAEEFDAVGGYLNAYTSKEHTVFSAKVLKNFLTLALDMLADIMFNSVYEHEDIEKEKNVVLQELAQTQDTPEEMVFEYYSEKSFSDQALGRSILGDEATINSFNQEKIRQFIKDHYTANNIIIVAAGDLSHSQLVDLVVEKFMPFIAEKIVTIEPGSYIGGHRFEHNKKLAQFNLVIGYEGLPVATEEYYQLDMLASILGGSLSSRLFQEIREKRGLVYSIGSFTQYYTDTGTFGISLGTSSDKVQELLKVMSNEINKIANDISQDEVDRCMAQVRASLYMNRETVDSWTGILASNYVYYGRYISVEEIVNGYQEVTISQLQDMAKRIFTKQKPITIAALGDVKKLPDYQQIQDLMTI